MDKIGAMKTFVQIIESGSLTRAAIRSVPRCPRLFEPLPPLNASLACRY